MWEVILSMCCLYCLMNKEVALACSQGRIQVGQENWAECCEKEGGERNAMDPLPEIGVLKLCCQLLSYDRNGSN